MRSRRVGTTGAPHPMDVIGVPVLPPGSVAPWLERARGLLAAVDRRITPPPVQILEGIFGLLDGVALGALCALEVPEALDRPMRIPELARRVEADSDTVDRLTRYGAARGWLVVDRRGRIRANRTTRFLRRDHPGGWRNWIEFHRGPEVIGALTSLGLDPRSPDAFEQANGLTFFDWYQEHPERGAIFDAAMSAGGRLHGLALASGLDWRDHRRVCDIGGGSGAVLRTLLARHPHLEGVLFDLPEVVARADPTERLSIEAGDAFVAVPGGCDLYLLVNVIHDWDDDRAVAILATIARTSPGATVVVVDAERRRRPADGIAARTDLLMLALAPGGRERTTDEFAGLAERAGLALVRSVPLASVDRAHLMKARRTGV